MENYYGFTVREHPKVPGKFFVCRNGKMYVSDKRKTTYMSEAQCHITIQEVIKEIESRGPSRICGNGSHEVKSDILG